MSKKILVIDDDKLVTESVRRVLEKRGYVVDISNNGNDGIQKARDGLYDLIISDVRMPELDGIKAIESIKATNDRNGKRCGYMFITGYADDDAPAKADRLGISDFLLKPFDVDRFLKLVDDQFEALHLDSKEPLRLETKPDSLIGKWKFPNQKFVFEKPILLKETNLMGNTYYDNYVTWQGEGRERLLLCHPAIKEFFESSKHIKMITHSTYHRFITETTFGDLVRGEVVSREIKHCSFILVFRFFNVQTDVILGEGWQKVCFMDLRTGKLASIPQLILDLIEPVREDESKSAFKV